MKLFYLIATPVGKLIALVYSFTNNYLLSVLLCVFVFDIFLIWLDIIKKKSENKLEIITPKILELDKKYSDRKTDAKQKQEYNDKIAEVYEKNNYTGASVFILPIINVIISIMFFIAISSPLYFISGLSPETITDINKFFNSSGFSFHYTVQLQIVDYINQNGMGILTEKFPELLNANIPNLTAFGMKFGAPASFTNIAVIFPLISIIYSVITTVKNLKGKIDINQLKQFDIKLLPPLMFAILPVIVSIYLSFSFSVLLIVYTMFTTGTRFLKTFVINKIFDAKKKRKENEPDLPVEIADSVS